MRILIIDDEPRIRTTLQGLLEDAGYRVWQAGSGEEGLKLLAAQPFDAVFLDVMLPGITGLETLRRLNPGEEGPKVLMMSGQADLAMAVEATRLGAVDFFEKPLNPDRVLLAARQIAAQLNLEKRLGALEAQLGETQLIGDSPAMRGVMDLIRRAAPSEGRVLILGENGTGKELVARALHAGSARSDGPFISLNCAAIPRDLVESELFGHEKGAFTGAVRRKAGRFELADGGTLFLDEIGDMDLDTQAKLLRVLQEGEAVRIGGETPYAFDVRVIAATNRDLAEAIAAGRFREDLYYRLNVVPIHIPPLRERREDISALARHFLDRFTIQSGKGARQWSQGAFAALAGHDWPGNVRELENTVERLVILGDGIEITGDEVRRVLPASTPPKPSDGQSPLPQMQTEGSFRERVEAYEREILVQGLERTQGNISMLARDLQMDRANLHRKLKQFGLK